MNNIPIDLSSFLQNQLQLWSMAKDNYEALSLVETRSLICDGVQLSVQFNPKRIVSSAAKTDVKSIQARPCFLCAKNRPKEQKCISYNERFEILVNPFPIFPQHFTVPINTHQPQQILPYIGDMLDLAKDFPDFLVFYNGPKCGASAPDHMHFQLGNKGFLPLEKDYSKLDKEAVPVFAHQHIKYLQNTFFNALIIETENKQLAEERFRFLYKNLQQVNVEEPMMNVLCWHNGMNYVLVILPRKKHRPWQFFAEGDQNILLSPASVDLGGVLITPLQKDFEKITEIQIENIISQLCFTPQEVIDKLVLPTLTVGILSEPEVKFCLRGDFRSTVSDDIYSGNYSVSVKNGKIAFQGILFDEVIFEPIDYNASVFELEQVLIGVDFHWQRRENQQFKGSLKCVVEDNKVTAINKIPVEDYLVSVISSEMSATSSLQLLKAHAVISRSWVLSQIEHKGKLSTQNAARLVPDTERYIKWYDHETHHIFDVCADDHCQRYQGVTRANTPAVVEAVAETKGEVLMFEDAICDARFSKSCGGVTEQFSTCWGDEDVPYLTKIVDGEEASFANLDLTQEKNAEKWIRTSPPSFCNTADKKTLTQVLNNYDQETNDFYRWKVQYSQAELSEIVRVRSGVDFGQIINLIPVKRGVSGRIQELKIVGTERTLIVGKELEIRKWLSRSHLYSSAFVVDKTAGGDFIFTGAGWGHGVGLCQIGAAVMGEKGYRYKEILLHYFRGAELKKIY